MNFFKKWYIYQKERFPILTYGLYCFCVVFATFCFSNSYLINNNFINYKLLIPMFIVAILQFLMVRIIDEFKDYEEDSKYRPYRPVPRGLITLKELKVLFIICCFIQIIITSLVNPKSLILLAVVWLFFGIMTKGFFIKSILDKHILCEVAFDELLLPITALYLSSFVGKVEFCVIWKLLVYLYIVSWIIEIARKIRCKEAEENGVKTYTAVFGIPKATFLLWILEILLFLVNVYIIKFKLYISISLIIITFIDIVFVIEKSKIFSKLVEYLADFYVMMSLISFIFLVI